MSITSGTAADAATTTGEGWCASRRTLLAGAGAGLGAMGAAGLLAACGTAQGQPATPVAVTTAGSADTSGGTSTGSAAVLARTGDVPVGGGEVVDGVLIVQPVAGTFKAYNAACPHKGVLVGTPVDGLVVCPAHKSTFSAADGHRISGPATQGLTAIAVTVDGTDIHRS